ncbi:hypothetical protein HY449_00745 [Candidatus Pacearchaeota archaeon]|nr:hypothetical protein [Candidatus Pacearchaeota archaeon]
MGDIGSDTEAQLEMMRDAYRDLRNKCPNHELLKLASLHQDEEGFDFTPEFGRRCVRTEDRYKASSYARYTIALESAAQNSTFKLLDTNPSCDY